MKLTFISLIIFISLVLFSCEVKTGGACEYQNFAEQYYLAQIDSSEVSDVRYIFKLESDSSRRVLDLHQYSVNESLEFPFEQLVQGKRCLIAAM
ncbi:MAG: hypothetical protein HRT74_02910 [Flavobacteriales bacterium]|nr:hypothetical protein [Flavobacteriales bacterium]